MRINRVLVAIIPTVLAACTVVNTEPGYYTQDYNHHYHSQQRYQMAPPPPPPAEERVVGVPRQYRQPVQTMPSSNMHGHEMTAPTSSNVHQYRSQTPPVVNEVMVPTNVHGHQ